MTKAPDWIQLDDSPLAGFLEIDQNAETEGASCRITVDTKHLNPNGSLHGGVMFTMLDLVMGVATSAHLAPQQMCATSEIHIRYLKPVFQGTVEATATVLNPGSRIVQLEARATDDRGGLVASATGSFVVLERREGAAPA